MYETYFKQNNSSSSSMLKDKEASRAGPIFIFYLNVVGCFKKTLFCLKVNKCKNYFFGYLWTDLWESCQIGDWWDVLWFISGMDSFILKFVFCMLSSPMCDPL